VRVPSRYVLPLDFKLKLLVFLNAITMRRFDDNSRKSAGDAGGCIKPKSRLAVLCLLSYPKLGKFSTTILAQDSEALASVEIYTLPEHTLND